MQAVCVYCGSRLGTNPVYRDAAIALGKEMARRELRLIYGGGNVGLMGVVADTVLEQGGKVTGVIPRLLVDKEVAHAGLSELILVETMHERKAQMAHRADAFVALPGGFGTYEELCEQLTWIQLGVHAKPCALFNVAGFYDPLLALFDHAMEEGFLKPKTRSLMLTGNSAAGVLDTLAVWKAHESKKWLDETQT